MKVENIVAQSPKRVKAFYTPAGQVIVRVGNEQTVTTRDEVSLLKLALEQAGYKIILSQTLRGIWRATRQTTGPAPWFTIEAGAYTVSASVGTDKIQYRDN